MSYRQKEIAALAAEALKDHVLTDHTGGLTAHTYRLKRPDSGYYSFWVTLLPGTIVVCGDVGDAILNVSLPPHELLGWIIRNCGEENPTSYDYVASKIRTSKKEFDERLAKDWLQEIAAEEAEQDAAEMEEMDQSDSCLSEDKDRTWVRDRVARVLEAWPGFDDPTEPHHAFYIACTDEGFEPEDIGLDYSVDHYWTIECLRTFARLVMKAHERG